MLTMYNGPEPLRKWSSVSLSLTHTCAHCSNDEETALLAWSLRRSPLALPLELAGQAGGGRIFASGTARDGYRNGSGATGPGGVRDDRVRSKLLQPVARQCAASLAKGDFISTLAKSGEASGGGGGGGAEEGVERRVKAVRTRKDCTLPGS